MAILVVRAPSVTQIWDADVSFNESTSPKTVPLRWSMRLQGLGRRQLDLVYFSVFGGVLGFCLRALAGLILAFGFATDRTNTFRSSCDMFPTSARRPEPKKRNITATPGPADVLFPSPAPSRLQKPMVNSPIPMQSLAPKTPATARYKNLPFRTWVSLPLCDTNFSNTHHTSTRKPTKSSLFHLNI